MLITKVIMQGFLLFLSSKIIVTKIYRIMPVKLFTIGDSISQGFMSGAAAKTDQCYSTLLSKLLQCENYSYPKWEKGGLPLDLETVFRRLEEKLKTDISGPLEWMRAVSIINKYLNEVENYYERGGGSLSRSIQNDAYHNVSVRGFDISNSWQLTQDMCKEQVDKSEKNGDNFFGVVNEALHRTAYKVLGSGDSKNRDRTQLGWLKYHHETEGVENLILWLGANNALGTVTNLKINQTSPDGTAFSKGPEKVSYQERLDKDWNLWHPEDFRAEYKFMLRKVIDIMEKSPKKGDYKVFIGTIPLVTVCPLIKAVESYGRNDIKVEEWIVNPSNPAPTDIDQLSDAKAAPVSYGKYYPYFLFEDTFDITLRHLNQRDVLHIDNCIRKYNRIIQEIVVEANQEVKAKRFYLVDLATALNKMALKRNHYDPSYEFPDYFKYSHPRIDSRYYGVTRDWVIKAGGLFSLDGVHPTAIGQGLIAYEFLKVMKIAGVHTEKDIDWKEIFKSDTLYSSPIGLLGEIYDNAEFKEWIYKRIYKTWEHKKY
jgi:lysophospholipase L1-like esterase